MHRNLAAIGLLSSSLLLTACNPAKSDMKQEILGRWENASWSTGGENLYAQFTADGTVQFNGSYGTVSATWLILDSGDLQTTLVSGISKRCKASVAGRTLTLVPPTCLHGWDNAGESIALTKQ